jgi:hypothetical protein
MTEAVEADAIAAAVRSLEPEVARLELARLGKEILRADRRQQERFARRKELFAYLVENGDTRVSVARLAGVTQTVVSLAIGFTKREG